MNNDVPRVETTLFSKLHIRHDHVIGRECRKVSDAFEHRISKHHA